MARKPSFLILKTQEGAEAIVELLSNQPKRLPLDFRKPTQDELLKQKKSHAKLRWYITDEWKEGESEKVREQFALSEEERREYQHYVHGVQLFP